MKTKVALIGMAISALCVSVSLAADRKHLYSVAEAMDHPDWSAKVGDEIRFYFGDQGHPAVEYELGEFVTNKKTNAFGKSDRKACRWVFMSAMISLRERAIAEGGNAVVNIRSYYKKREVSSEDQYECHAGTAIAGVALIGEVVQFAD